jgi:hypothetical protein
MPSIYDITGLFPGPNGVGTTEINSHPATFISGSSSITLGSNESGIYIPLANFTHSPEALNPLEDNYDVRYLIWNLVERCSDYIGFEQPEFRSISVAETNLFTFQGVAGDLRRKDYTVSLWFRPLQQLELEQNLEWDIGKTYE